MSRMRQSRLAGAQFAAFLATAVLVSLQRSEAAPRPMRIATKVIRPFSYVAQPGDPPPTPGAGGWGGYSIEAFVSYIYPTAIADGLDHTYSGAVEIVQYNTTLEIISAVQRGTVDAGLAAISATA